MTTKLTKKEKEFCALYVKLRNAREAAALAGYKVMPQINGIRLLSKEAVAKEIARLSRLESAVNEAAAGFRRLAFGSVSDAVRLLDGERENLEEMDLFSVSDIKIPKGGGMEIKFYDRQKALECLAQLETSESTGSAVPFYKALEKSVDFLSGTPEYSSYGGDDSDEA